MDKIDSFVIEATEIGGTVDFTFVLVEDDMPEDIRDNIVDYIDNLTRKLNLRFPQYKFTWQEAHRITPDNITEEIIHQHIVQKRFN